MLSATPRPCPLCGPGVPATLVAAASVDPERLGKYAFASRKVPEYMHHRLVRCKGCGLVYADPCPTPEQLTDAYALAAFDTAATAAFAARTYARLIEPLVHRLPSQEGALDVGTGDGALLGELLKMGFTGVVGVEPSRAPVEQADPSLRPLIRLGPFDPSMFAGRTFSLITCCQTIEHLHNPVGFCAAVGRMLRPGGMLLLVSHNYGAISRRVMGSRSPIFDIEHLQLFDRQSARLLLLRAGLVDVDVRPILNRYPVSYWSRMAPLPSAAKSRLQSALSQSVLGRVQVTLPAGNLAATGFRSRR